MAHFDKAIPPGGEGNIKIQVRTKGYQGKVRKSAKVKTNDPENELIVLRVHAFVKVPIYVSSRYISFYGKPDQTTTRVVEVRAELDKPLTLEPSDFTVAGKVKYTIEEVVKGKKYNIRFTNIPGETQNYHGILRLKTNYAEKPEIRFRIRGYFKPLAKPLAEPRKTSKAKHGS